MTSEFPVPVNLTQAPAGSGTTASIQVRGLWKIFGPGEHKIIGTPMAELSRGSGQVDDATAANAIVLAAASNTLVKGGLVWALATGGMRVLIAPAVGGAVIASVALTFLL